MGWFSDAVKAIDDAVDDATGGTGLDSDDLDIFDAEEDIDDADIDIESIIAGDPEEQFDAITDVGESIPDITGDADIGNLFGTLEDLRDKYPDLSIEDLADPVLAAEVAHDINLLGTENIIDVSGNREEYWQDIFGDELGSYLYNTQLVPGNITPTSEEDFQNFGSDALFGEDGTLISVNEEIEGGLLGGDAADATAAAAQSQMDSSRRALGLLREDLAPFKDILSDRQLSDLSMLSTDVGAQTSFLSDNALLDKIRGDVKGASFREQTPVVEAPQADITDRGGRITGGIKGEQTGAMPITDLQRPRGISTDDIISRNFIDAGNDIINQQINRQLPLLSTGQSSAAQSATGSSNLLTGAGNAAAAGRIGAANAESQGAQNTASMIALIASMFSDDRLKKNEKKIGEHKGLNVYTWDWNKEAEKLGLEGSDFGHIAQEVKKKHPDLVSKKNGYLAVDYGDNRTVK